jgi:hydroxylamine dehydrogenase
MMLRFSKMNLPIIIATLVFVGLTAMVFAFYVLRPRSDTAGRGPIETRATGRCASCHFDLSPQMIEMHEHSLHASKGVSCIECHSNQEGQPPWEHHEFVITESVTSKNCSRCHQQQYQEFLSSGHSLPAWSAIYGKEDLPQDTIEMIRQKHPELVERHPAALADQLPVSAIRTGCEECHKIGRPNSDGSVGNCIDCHSAHNSSRALASQPETCGRCHSGADHQQLAIYNSSKHGIIHAHLKSGEESNRPASQQGPSRLVPTCITCHMGQIGKLPSNHDISLRIANQYTGPSSEKRPAAVEARKEMQQVCMQCHSSSFVQAKFKKAEQVQFTVDQLIGGIGDEVRRIRGTKSNQPNETWDELDHQYFEAWHHFGHSAVHGAYMGSPGHVVWQGIYQLQKLESKLKAQAGKVEPMSPKN